MSELNLEVKLIATPWLAPSLLDNYYTKEEVGDLKEYVKEVENPEVNTIYGRQEVEGEMEWVPVLNTNNFLYYGMSKSNPITSEEVVTFSNVAYPVNSNTVEIEISSSTSGYVWFCISGEIESVTQLGNLVYTQPINKQSKSVTIDTGTGVRSWNITLNCYYTPKLIAGTYRFRVVRKEESNE